MLKCNLIEENTDQREKGVIFHVCIKMIFTKSICEIHLIKMVFRKQRKYCDDYLKLTFHLLGIKITHLPMPTYFPKLYLEISWNFLHYVIIWIQA